ncbi:alpha/beta hydrolase [Acuticoccus sediminis]|uniref:alpha/beta hydrolase n=1 Tax=Acuticoccus sediminis TaxID=2184697 RepID=UPI001CFCFF84|nr:alpha/beta hydrolase [Acuticoccus sediminis]
MTRDTKPPIRRGFVDIDEGQVHYRTAGEAHDGLPLVMIHPSPGSSLMLVPLMQRLARTRRVVALDTLGNGDSAPPRHLTRDILPYADAHARALAALGIDRFDLYGSHTGGNIACEIAIAHKDRVHRMILDGMSVYAPEEQADLLENYAPGITVDQSGGHIHWIFNFVRDTYLFWPWYKRDKAHVRDVGLPPADVLHDKVVEVLKAARTYHLPYQSALAYDKEARLPLVDVPTLLSVAATDMLAVYFDAVAALLPGAQHLRTPGVSTEADAETTVAGFLSFLDGR